MWRLLFKVLRLRGEIPREQKWDTVVDLFFYREPEEAEKEEQAAKELPAPKPEPVIDTQETDWTASGNTDNWAEETPAAAVPPAAAAGAAAAVAGGAPAPAPVYKSSDDWATLVQEDWDAKTNVQQHAQHNWTSNTEWH